MTRSIVLVHAVRSSRTMWKGQVRRLRDRGYEVITPDLPGHGASPAASESFTVEELADAVADAVGEPFLYAGVSLGGAVGLCLALRHPAQVRRAAILASGAKLGEVFSVPRPTVRRRGLPPPHGTAYRSTPASWPSSGAPGRSRWSARAPTGTGPATS